MSRYNFTKEENQILDLVYDLAICDYSHGVEGKVGKKELEEYLRERINKDILKGATMYQAMRRNNVVLFEIMEELVNISIVENVLNSPFINEFVEVKNRALGDMSAFYSEGGTLSVASFAGNHWDTNRQSIDLGEEFSLPKEWIYIHVYDELERFLLGINSMERLMDKVYQAVNKFIQDRIYAQFQVAANSIPTAWSFTGNSEVAVGNAVDVIQAAGGYNAITIAGTRAALRKLAGYIPTTFFADSQKEAKANTGSISMWEGSKLMVIPQTLKTGTINQLALDDTKLFIMGADVKPIKLEYFGDTRTDMDTTGKKYNDMTFDYQIQTKLGMGMLIPNAFGVFTLL